MQGHIHKRVHSTADGRTTTTWYVVVDVGRKPDGRRRQKWHGGYRTRKEAEAARARIVNDLNRGTYVEPSPITLAEWVNDTWLAVAKSRLKATTWDSYRRTLELHLLPAFGSMKLTDITPTALDRHYADLLENGRRNRDGGPLSARSVRYVHAVVRKVLADAVDAGLLAVNPAARAKPPRAPRSAAPTMNFWEPTELAQFLSHVAGADLEIAWHLLALTGMRRGEVLGVRWRDIDLDLARLSVRHTLVSVGYAMREEAPKSHQARVVDLDAGTVIKLRAHHLRQEAEKALLGDRFCDRDFVIAERDGSPVHPDRLTKLFQQAVKASGVRRIRLHDLRHTHASLALQAGIPVKVVSERLGHESPGFTLSQYAHVLPGMQAEAAELVRSIVAEAASGDGT